MIQNKKSSILLILKALEEYTDEKSLFNTKRNCR